MRFASTIRISLGILLLGCMQMLCAQEPTPAPDKTKELLAKYEQLQKQLAAEKPLVPSQCEIVGRIEKIGDNRIARLVLKYQFRTLQAKQTVQLGLKKAYPIEAKWSEGTPPLATTENGLTVAVEKAGEHQLELTVDAPIQTRGPRSPEVGFDLQLPGCPITILKWTGPDSIKRLRVGRREAANDAIDSKRYPVGSLAPGGSGEALGPIVYLELAWDEQGAAVAPQKERTAKSNWDVQVQEAEIKTTVTLLLSGEAREWRIAAPPSAQLTVARAGAGPNDATLDPPPAIVRPEVNQPPIWKIVFPENVSITLAATVEVIQLRGKEPKAKGNVVLPAIGVLDLPTQPATIKITSVSTLKVKEVPRGDTRRIPGPDNPLEILLRSNTVAFNEKGIPLPYAELDIRAAQGMVQSRVTNELTFSEAGWRLKSEIALQPIRISIDKVELILPTTRDLQNVSVTPAEVVEAVEPGKDIDANQRSVTVRLSSPKSGPFSIFVEGLYPQTAADKSAKLLLPRLPITLDRESQIAVIVPSGFEVEGQVREWNGDKAGNWTAPLDNGKARLARAAGEVELTWKPRLPRANASTIVDATVRDKSIRFDVECTLLFAEAPPQRLRWKIKGPISAIRTSAGARELGNTGELILPVPPLSANREAIVRFSYDFVPPTEEEAKSFLPPIPQLEAEGSSICKVRFWRDPSTIPEMKLAVDLEQSKSPYPWHSMPPEVVAERESLAYQVVQTEGNPIPELPASYLPDPDAGQQTRIWIDRVFAQSQTPDRLQRNRARYLLRRWLTRDINFLLPPGAQDVEILLNGKQVNSRTLPAQGPSDRVHFELPAWKVDRSAILEIRYTSPGSTLGFAEWDLPQPQGRVSLGPCRWQIALPGRSLPLAWSDADFEEAWSFKVGIPFPAAARGVQELERWFTSGEEPTEAAGWQLDEAGITAKQNHLQPLRVLLLPRYVSVLVFSGLVCGFGYLFLYCSVRFRWLIGIALVLLLISIQIINPQWLRALLSCCLPGIVGFAAIAGYQAYHRWRYWVRSRRMSSFQLNVDYLSERNGSHTGNRGPSTKVKSIPAAGGGK